MNRKRNNKYKGRTYKKPLDNYIEKYTTLDDGNIINDAYDSIMKYAWGTRVNEYSTEEEILGAQSSASSDGLPVGVTQFLGSFAGGGEELDTPKQPKLKEEEVEDFDTSDPKTGNGGFGKELDEYNPEFDPTIPNPNNGKEIIYDGGLFQFNNKNPKTTNKPTGTTQQGKKVNVAPPSNRTSHTTFSNTNTKPVTGNVSGGGKMKSGGGGSSGGGMGGDVMGGMGGMMGGGGGGGFDGSQQALGISTAIANAEIADMVANMKGANTRYKHMPDYKGASQLLELGGKVYRTGGEVEPPKDTKTKNGDKNGDKRIFNTSSTRSSSR